MPRPYHVAALTKPSGGRVDANTFAEARISALAAPSAPDGRLYYQFRFSGMVLKLGNFPPGSGMMP
jgi:hypothetical protein